MSFAASAAFAEADRLPGASIRRLDGRAEVPRREDWPRAVGVGTVRRQIEGRWAQAPLG